MRLTDYFPAEDLDKIEEVIESVELKTSGELRVVVAEACPPGLEGDIERYAEVIFDKLDMGNTRDRTGVLILMDMSQRKLRILADFGINEKLASGYLQSMVSQTTWHFNEARYTEGLIELVTSLGKKLAMFFPPRADDINELPNRVILLPRSFKLGEEE
jgi:uncharacterized membrane protein